MEIIPLIIFSVSVNISSNQIRNYSFIWLSSDLSFDLKTISSHKLLVSPDPQDININAKKDIKKAYRNILTTTVNGEYKK